MENLTLLRSIGTHDGTFHADEVTACALLLLCDLIDRDKIFRTRDLNRLAQCEFVCDVGGIYDPKKKRFDHHQSDYPGELSSAGMILSYLNEEHIISSAAYDYLNKSLILGVDAHDNGRVTLLMGHCSFSGVISNFVPIVHGASDEVLFEAFMKALDFAYEHLKRLMSRFEYIESCKKDVLEAMKSQEKCLFFENSIPWLDAFFESGGGMHPALFLIMPTRDHWKLRGIPPSLEKRMEVRMPLPEKWAGLLNEELKKASGIDGAIFCHKGRFISVWETKEDAIKALELTLKDEK